MLNVWMHGCNRWCVLRPTRRTHRHAGDHARNHASQRSTHAQLTVTRSTAINQTVTVHYASADGSASAGSDYSAISGTLTFPANTLTRTLTLSATGDTALEGDEPFAV